MKKYAAVIFASCLFSFGQVSGQTIYNMSNAFVIDCQGTLLDSEDGNNGTTYDNNENFTFKICSGGKITMTFSSTFCIDSGFDWLRFFNGPDTNSPLLGKYTGYIAPPTIVANSGCLTVHFKSDATAAYCGWEADWTTEKVPPIPPVMTVGPVPACSTNQIKVNFSKKILCDSVSPNDFSITGPVSNIFVTSMTSSLNCRFPGDSTNTLTLILNKSLSLNCWYDIEFHLGLPDNCDSIWYFDLVDSFKISDCPFTVNIMASYDTVCQGMCTDLTAIVNGNGPNCLNYNYTWNHGLTNSAGPHTVCPVGNITYTVTVQPTTGGSTASAFKTIYYVNPVITDNDTLYFCQSDSLHVISVNSSGGKFYGNGIVNNTTGLFNPDLAGPGSHYIKYGFANYCLDSILIIIKAIDAGLDEAACPGTAPFLLKGFSPAGGTWTGDSVKTNGLFNPALPGTYIVTYHYNGCSESKKVIVDSIVLNTNMDTICQSVPPFNISITPAGGRWSGPGITDSVLGTFNPLSAGTGLKNLTYKLSGVNACSFNVAVRILPVNASYDLLACPSQPAFILTPGGTPTGGTWSGLGITNSSTGLYNPAMAFGGLQGNDTLTYTAPNGCSDQRILYVRYTIVYQDSLFFCKNDAAIYLDWVSVQRTPGGGVWTGSGITNSGGSNYYFNPAIAGVGAHKLYYKANTCVDSIIMVVYPLDIKKTPFNYLWPDTVVCSNHPVWNFPVMPPGGKWEGKGITNKKTGTYSPAVAGAGNHIIKYITPKGCVDDSIIVTVYQFVAAQILNLDSVYCYKDTLIPITYKPVNAKLTGNGIVNGQFFNPKLAGEGSHIISCEFGNGFCYTSTEKTIKVTKELLTSFSVSDTLLCPGESAEISVVSQGGPSGTQYTYVWNNGLFPVSSHIVSPDTSTWYIVKTSDGCSEPVIDSIYIVVANAVKTEIETSAILCFGADGFAKVILDDPDKYNITWGTKPEQNSDSIEGLAGSSYTLNVEDKETGCSFDTLVKIPSYKNVVASFTTSPNFDCIPSGQKLVTFLDLSHNADSGNWDIAGLQNIPYELGQNPSYQFTEAGYYKITLTVFNEGGCSDEFVKELCVEDIRPVFVADAFTPNGDGINDVLHVKAKGVKEMRFQIFDRWGNLVFETSNMEEGWNGQYRGMNANAGVYIYIIESKLINNETSIEKGNVTLVR